MNNYLEELRAQIKGEFYFDHTPLHNSQLLAYSTDASVYQEKPLAVALPKDSEDIKVLVEFATKNKITLVPRAAGTSLAGQVVSNGIIVDISKYFDQILEVNVDEKWVKLQPGVIRDDLNHYLRSYGLFFGPETSTASRAMVGGMVGNNSCGLHSIVWGDVRRHIMELKLVLYDGSELLFKPEDIADIEQYTGVKKVLYDGIVNLLDRQTIDLIKQRFPKKTVVRRNTGYALDSLISMKPFSDDGEKFNLCKLIAGSEGTLGFITEIKLGLIPLPPKEVAVVCIHCHTLDEALRANTISLNHHPMASELVDKYIMDFTINHPEYHKNRFFIEGDPAAILMVEFMESSLEAVENKINALISDLKENHFGYSFPVLYNEQTRFAWDIRKAGLGLLRNRKGDVQPVNLIEDCAVSPTELPDYIKDLQVILKKHKVQASYYAHAGAGELHVEPMINLKTREGLSTFREVLTDTVDLVKKYKGSLSGEHGDGRLRGEFISSVVGNEIYDLFKRVKLLFDPHGIFNAGKIVNTPPMDTHLRVKIAKPAEVHKTYFDFSLQEGIAKLAEKCSGSGDCRRSEISGGLMCPSYMATRKEKDTTRARANLLRQFLNNTADPNPFNHEEIKEVMDLCLSCKGCKVECPSGVDVTKMKAEFLQHYYDANGVPFRSSLIANFSKQMKLASLFSPIYNFIFGHVALRKVANKLVGFHPDRSIPLLPKITLKRWFHKRSLQVKGNRKVYLFCDEFTNYLDVEIGKKAVLLLEKLGYEILIPTHLESGRSYLSKGLVKKAALVANKNIELLSDNISETVPLIGIEPSAILTIRDEYIDLANESNKQKAATLAKHTFTIEEFLCMEYRNKVISTNSFTDNARKIALHGHCYQKVLSSQSYLEEVLTIPLNYKVEIIPSGCCGMAGAFGYEREHYEISQKVGGLVLYPYLTSLSPETIIAASGTSCRHQIKDGLQKTALHPIEILFNALV